MSATIDGIDPMGYTLQGHNERQRTQLPHAPTMGTLDMDMDAVEMDSTVFERKKNLGHLSNIRNIRGAFERFDLAPDDIIDRREQVQMFRTIEEGMLRGINDLTSTAKYDDGKELHNRLASLKEQFAHLQVEETDREQARQTAHFKAASKHLKSITRAKHADDAAATQGVCDDKADDMHKSHSIQNENCELEINLLNKPRIKYSKRLLELQKAEESLIRLKRFDEAKNVRRMIDRILPLEEAKYESEWEALKQGKRDKLSGEQEGDLKRLDERLGTIQWRDTRLRDKEKDNMMKRLSHHNVDMTHAHMMDSEKNPELSVHPSMLLTRRANHDSTGASLRGTQLLGNVKGKKKDQAVFVAGLCDIHDFKRPLNGTETIHSKGLYDSLK